MRDTFETGISHPFLVKKGASLIAFLVLMQHLSPLLKPYFSVFPLFYVVFYFRLTIIPRHRNINRTLTSIDILQLLFFFQSFDMSGGSGVRKCDYTNILEQT